MGENNERGLHKDTSNTRLSGRIYQEKEKTTNGASGSTLYQTKQHHKANGSKDQEIQGNDKNKKNNRNSSDSTELLQNYNLDGIHFDYIRYHALGWGMNPTGLKFFLNYSNGMPGLPALEVKQKPSFDDYKRSAITKFLKRFVH